MKIELIGMQFHSFHGYYTEEQSVGNEYELDVILQLDKSPLEMKDRLEQTINYEVVYSICTHHMSEPSKLIETVAQRIIDEIRRTFSDLLRIEVTLRKKAPFLGGIISHAGVQLTWVAES